MTVIRDLESVNLEGVVLTVGNFDGVHRGHQAIIALGRKHANRAKTQLVAMTFDPHPAAVITPDRIPPALTTLEEKTRLLELAGANIVVVVESKPEFLNISAEQFITDVIMARFKPIAIIEGASFGFGQHRRGDTKTLAHAAKTCGFKLEVVEPVRAALGGHPDTVISSSLVRHLINSGTVDQAALCLGRPYTLIGSVVPGAGRGKKLGFPTANINTQDQLIPAEGIYSGMAEVQNQTYSAAVSIGKYPTFEGNELTIEAYLLDFTGQIYNHDIRLQFLEWLRQQKKFDSPEDLAKQIEKDVKQTRKIVDKHRIAN